jgi:hypothetical protein
VPGAPGTLTVDVVDDAHGDRITVNGADNVIYSGEGDDIIWVKSEDQSNLPDNVAGQYTAHTYTNPQDASDTLTVLLNNGL